jgi:dienelactone hydrolase
MKNYNAVSDKFLEVFATYKCCFDTIEEMTMVYISMEHNMKLEMVLWVFCGCLILNTEVWAQVPASQATTQPKIKMIRGTVPARFHRPIAPSTDPAIGALLKQFETNEKSFDYRMGLISENDSCRIYRVLFPSPVVTNDPANNTVWCEYYQSKVKGPRPAVVVLHPIDLEARLMRRICSHMASSGIDSLWLEIAYYGDRSKPLGLARQLMLLQDTDALIGAVVQSVKDIRRASEFLASRPDVIPGQVNLMGFSLGGLMTALTMGVDGNYPRAVTMVGGADLAKIFSTNQAIQMMFVLNKEKDKIDEEFLQQRLKPIEPLTYVSRAKNTKLLMFNAAQDEVIPPVCSKELCESLPGTKIKWYDVPHPRLPVDDVMLQEIGEFFKNYSSQ